MVVSVNPVRGAAVAAAAGAAALAAALAAVASMLDLLLSSLGTHGSVPGNLGSRLRIGRIPSWVVAAWWLVVERGAVGTIRGGA